MDASERELVALCFQTTYTSTETDKVREAEAYLRQQAEVNPDFPMLLVEIIAGEMQHESPIRMAAVIYLHKLFMHGFCQMYGMEIFQATLSSLVEIFEIISDAFLPVIKRLSDGIAFDMCRSGSIGDFADIIVRLYEEKPRASIILACGLAKEMAPSMQLSDLYETFTSTYIPMLVEIRDDLQITFFHMLSRLLDRCIPPIIAVPEMTQFLVEKSLAILSSPGAFPIELYQYVLRFLARLASKRSEVILPVELAHAALTYASSQISDLCMSYSLHLLYGLAGREAFNEFLPSQFESILTQIVLPLYESDLEAATTEQRSCWEDPFSASKDLVLRFLSAYPALVPWMMQWISERPADQICPALLVLSYCVREQVEANPECLDSFYEWVDGLLSMATTVQEDDFKICVLNVVGSCSKSNPEWIAACYSMIGPDSSPAVRCQATATISHCLKVCVYDESSMPALSEIALQVLENCVELEMEFMTEELAIATNTTVSYLKNQLTVLTPDLFLALGTIFQRFVEQNNNCYTMIGNSIIDLIMTGALDCAFLLDPMSELLTNTCSMCAVDKIMEIFAAIIHSTPVFDPAMWNARNVCFAAIEHFDNFSISDASLVLSNLIWRSQGTFLEEYEVMVTYLGGLMESTAENPKEWVMSLGILGDLVLAIPEYVKAVAIECVSYMLEHAVGVCMMDCFTHFVNALFIRYPEDAVANEALYKVWLNCATVPEFHSAAMACWQVLPDPLKEEVAAVAVQLIQDMDADAELMEDYDIDDELSQSDALAPEWFNALDVINEFREAFKTMFE